MIYVAHTCRAAPAGLPGEAKFALPSPDAKEDVELRMSLRGFVKEVTNPDGPMEKDGPPQRQTEIVRVAVQALALLASTEKTNKAISEAFQFIDAAPKLKGGEVRRNL
jgi:hypothetical protein